MASTLPDKLRAVLEANPSDAELAATVRSLVERADAAKRRPRFKRADDVPAIKPSDRDRAILEAVRTHRCLFSHQITRLLSDRWNEHETVRRLGPLFHHGYLDRPANQRHLFPAEQTSWPLVYAVGPLGAAFLAEHAAR